MSKMQTQQARINELEGANAALKIANESLEAFTYVVSHDLKAPVRAVDIILQELEDEELARHAQDILGHARRANQRLSALLTGLLAYSRAGIEGADSATDVSIIAALQHDDCRTRFADLLEEAGGRLEYPNGDASVRGHIAGLCQILGNVIQNAVVHNDKDKPIVRVFIKKAPDGMIEIVVEDNGPGFPKGKRDVPQTLEKTTSSFGLTISTRIAKRMGGRLWIDHDHAPGAAVHFTLPNITENE